MIRHDSAVILALYLYLAFHLIIASALQPQNLNLHSQQAKSTLNLPLTPPNAPLYPIHCFNPTSPRLYLTVIEDCRLIINNIILAYPSPMESIVFGYSDAVDFDLRIKANEKWFHRGCVIFLKNRDEMATDTFRIVDVAVAAERVVNQCVAGTKYGVGGTTDVGTRTGGFHIGLGGWRGRGPSVTPASDKWRRERSLSSDMG